jgi:TPR repeat protein
MPVEDDGDMGNSAYRLYCKCRCGASSAFEEFEKKSAESTGRAQLLWRGYHASALFYTHKGVQYKSTGAVTCSEILPALLTAAVTEDNNDNDCDPHVQYLLGWCYHNGQGVVRDNTEAVRWFSKAAKQGLAIAQSNLGICYDNGDSVPVHHGKALSLYRKAAEQGHSSAQFNIGLNYENGDAVTKDLFAAAAYYKLAADQGLDVAQNAYAWCFFKGEGVDFDPERGVELFCLAAEQGLPSAQFMLGWCHDKGYGTPANPEIACVWFHRAAQADVPLASACFMLGECYRHGRGVVVDVFEAVRFYRKALKLGYGEAQTELDGIKDVYEEAVSDMCYIYVVPLVIVPIIVCCTHTDIFFMNSVNVLQKWNTRKDFMLFLAQYQFIYRPAASTSIGATDDDDMLSLEAMNALPADPDIVHTVFYTDDMRRVIMSYV